MKATTLRWQVAIGTCAAIAFIYFFFLTWAHTSEETSNYSSPSQSNDPWTAADQELGASRGRKLAHNFALTEQQCDDFFPHLYDDLQDSAEARKGVRLTFNDIDSIPADVKHTRAMIYDGDLYVLEDYNKVPEERTISLLSSLHRALVADPESHTIPNIEFILSRDDFCDPGRPLWCLTRYKPPFNNWLMPDFGFWTWPISSVGSYSSIQRRIKAVEAEYDGFAEKIPKLIWRGSMDVDHDTRVKLVEASRNRPWSAVEPMVWYKDGEASDPTNLIQIEDHCRYQFLAHSEGNTYSGRQKYLHNCNSVVVAHPLMWIQPFHRLMVADGPNQNYVQVRKDYSDLEEKMDYYLAHPKEADRIAANSVKTFRDRYLTPAAEACYWRKLVRIYGSVSFAPQYYSNDTVDGRKVPRGTAFETYLITGNLDGRPRRMWVDSPKGH